MLCCYWVVSTTYARDRNGDNERDYGSRGRSSSRREKESGPRLNYDGRTSGIGNRVGGIAGTAAGGAKGGFAGGFIGGELGGKVGDSWERRANRGAHDKWNNKGRKDRGYGGGWRFSDEID